MQTISSICALLGGACVVFTPIIFMVFIVMAFFKSKFKRVFGFITLALVGAFIFFYVISTLTDSATWCDHQWEQIETIEASCTEQGFTTKYCPLCDNTETEYTDKLEHTMVEVERMEATETQQGKITMRCKNCKYETIEKLDQKPGVTTDGDIQGIQNNNIMPDIETAEDNISQKLISIGFNEEEANEMRAIFIKCGVTDIDECTITDPNASIDNLAAFRAVWDKNKVFWFTIDNRELLYMSLNGVDVYDKDKGGFLINVNDIHIPETNVSIVTGEKLRDMTEQTLDKYFVNARYYDAFGYARRDNEYMVQCQVYASNAIGAKDWIFAKVWFTSADDSFKVVGVQIDGKQYDVK